MNRQSYSLRVFSIVILLTLVASVALAIPPVRYDKNGNPIYPICATEDVWQKKQERLPQDLAPPPKCGTEGACDNPSNRDNSSQSAIVVSVIVHVINNNNGSPPNGVTQADVDAQMAQMNADYASRNIQFVYTTEFHNDGDFYCISAYSPFNSGWWSDIQSAKARYFRDTDTNLNVLVTCQNSSPWGILLGIGTFPWDSDAPTSAGGLWVNSAYFGGGNKTLTHEAGHCLGLWHTHHGVSEMSGCSDRCYENAHPAGDPAADLVGDYCSDTPPTPTNYNCSDPGGTDCDGRAWNFYGPTDYGNFMGYGRDSCVDHFTTNQSARMHCWTRSQLAGWIAGSCPDPPPAAPSGLSANAAGDGQIDVAWSDNGANEDGFRIERDSGGGFAEIATVGPNVENYSDGGLNCGTPYSYRVRAYNCGGNSGYSNPVTEVTGSCPTGPTAHVADVTVTPQVKRRWNRGRGTVTIVDQNNNPIAGATVSADWSGSASQSQTATTGSDGVASFQSARNRTLAHCYTLAVTDVQAAGYTYDFRANVEDSDEAGNFCDATARVLTASRRASLTNHPNPFNPTTTFHFTLPAESDVSLRIYDASGRLITTLVSESRGAGTHSVTWNGAGDTGIRAASGVYYARLVADNEVVTRRIVLLK